MRDSVKKILRSLAKEKYGVKNFDCVLPKKNTVSKTFDDLPTKKNIVSKILIVSGRSESWYQKISTGSRRSKSLRQKKLLILNLLSIIKLYLVLVTAGIISHLI